ncbi:MAG TPA: molybdopterin-guanine dinucleotide biosynthesis protein MobB [Thermoanaerobaculaceae bacterium]|nr:molybdopterin-guanine dinucleotide biosynthesis protein MobB [Thermoanaerobaculaceae bacterium]HPS77821.1 molybdopterin-guanine dinucleotide biosynthesis protein MobB [Thermoanaerobaculaceae bacterium]
MLVASFVGWSDSGKTTLIARLVEAFRARGRRVVAVKRGHGEPRLPADGKDTSRFLAAGAEAAYLLSADSMLRWQRAPAEPWELILRELGEIEVVLLEGLVVPGVMVVEVVRDGGAPGLKYPPAALAAVVGDRDPGAGVPFVPAADLNRLIEFLEGSYGARGGAQGQR